MMRKATLHISNNQTIITMPSTPTHKNQLNKRKDSASDQHHQLNQSIKTTKNIAFESKSIAPRSPSPLFDKSSYYENELLNTSNFNQTSSFRYPSHISQAALSSNLTTTMSNTHFNQSSPLQQINSSISSTTNQQTQLKTQQDLEEQYYSTIDNNTIIHNVYQNQKQKNSKPKLLRQKHAELMELPPRTRDRLPSATPSSFSNYSGTCGFTTNYTAGLTPPFNPNINSAYFEQTGISSAQTTSNEQRLSSSGASNYYSYWEDANSFVAQGQVANANAAAEAAQANSSNPTLRNATYLSNSQSSQTQQFKQQQQSNQSQQQSINTQSNDFNRDIREQQQNSMNTGRLASDLSQNDIDSSFEYLSRLNLRCRSVPLLEIYIKNEPDPIENEEQEFSLVDQHIVENKENKQEKELITFIDFLNENSTSNEKLDQIKEQQQNQYQQNQTQQHQQTINRSINQQRQEELMNTSNTKLEKIDSDEEDGYADVESVSEIMNFSNRQQTVIRRDHQTNHLIDIEIKDNQDESSQLIDSNIEKDDFIIDQLDNSCKFDEMKENCSPISDDGLELDIEDDEDIGNFGDTDEIKLLPTTPSTYSLFQKLMNKHNSGSKEGGNNSNQNTLRKHSSDIESQNRSNSLVNYNYHKHRHRRKKDDELLLDDVVGTLHNFDNQQQQHHHHHHHSEKNISPTTTVKPSYKKYSEGNDKRKQSSKKIKDKQHHRIYDMPNIDSLQHQQTTKLLKNEHILTSNSLPSSRSMQLCQENSFDQSNEQINEANNLIQINEQQKQLNMRSQSKESVKSPKNEKKKRKFSKKALHLLKVNHFRKSKSEETGKELETLANKTLSDVCKARSYNYNLIKNMNEYNLSQQSSVFNSANNSYEENCNLMNPNVNSQQPSNFYLDQQQQIYQSQQTHLNQYQHNQYPIQYTKTGSLGQHHLQTTTNIQPTSQLYQQQQSANTLEKQKSYLNAEQLMTDDTRLFAVHIQNTDRKLKSSKGIVNPFVRMHVVDLNTGESLQTSEFSYQSAIGANAGTYVGSMKGKEYIQPITTQPCDLLFKLKYPTSPIWEETLILNEPYNFLKQNDVILFFEILDYVRLDHNDLLGSFQLKHWSYRVAWGYFLLNNVRNQLDNQSNQMIKLQLYKPFMHAVEKTFEPYCQIYNWWKNYKRIPYPASLFLTLTTVSIGDLSNPKHPIHLRILNKSLNQQLLNQKRLPDYWTNTDNDYYQQQKNYDPNTNYPAIRNLKQYQQSFLNSSIEDQDQDQPIPSRIPFNQTMAMPSNQMHHNSQSFHQSLPSNTAQQSITQQTNISQRNWNKSSSTNSQQHCKLPSSTWHQLSAGNNKCCYNVAFSNDGTKIACCASVFTAYISTEKRSSIFIYDIPGGNFLQRVNGFHSAPIFYLDWSKGDKLLASASADATCQVWQMRRQHCAPLILNHPCMVYTVKFHPINATLLATGAYDGAVRIWCIQESLKSTIKEPVLLQCVTATGNIPGATFHAQVLALCWMSYLIDYIGPNGQTEQKMELLLFSGCTRGNLMALKQDELNLSWQPNKKMKIKEIMNIAINEIKCCPNENRLILFCRDGVQRMVDVFSETIIMRYIGSLNFNHLIRGCLSNDGRTLYAGSEDGIVHVWNVDTGTIASINYHPQEDIIAISGLNARTISVCLYKHYSNRELPSPSKQKLTSSDPNYSQQQSSNQQQQMQTTTTSTAKKASMVTSNEQGHTIVSFAHDEYKQDELIATTNKSVGSLGQTTTVAERTRLQAKIKPELKKSHTIDHSSNTASTPARTANQKVQKAMRKLAIRLSFNEKS